jgi:CRP/FNR family transcriptional regulator, cyclic AMP receptor protein
MSGGAESLGHSPMFAELNAEDVAQLGALCRWRSVKAGDVVIEEYALDNDAFFVVNGHARVLRGTNGREVILKDIRAGEYFGELSAIDGRPRSARIVAVTDSVVARMSAGVFRDAIHRHPSVCDHILATLSASIRALNERFSEQIYLDVRERLCAELIRLSRPAGKDRIVVSPPPTHLEIALRIGARREAVTKVLNALEREGAISRSRGAIALVEPERLRQIAAQGA